MVGCLLARLIDGFANFVVVGGLCRTVCRNPAEAGHAGANVDKILRGAQARAKPPIVQPAWFRLVVNSGPGSPRDIDLAEVVRRAPTRAPLRRVSTLRGPWTGPKRMKGNLEADFSEHKPGILTRSEGRDASGYRIELWYAVESPLYC